MRTPRHGPYYTNTRFFESTEEPCSDNVLSPKRCVPSNYAAEGVWYFYPPFTANYSFYLAGDDKIEVFIGTNADDMTKICSVPNGETGGQFSPLAWYQDDCAADNLVGPDCQRSVPIDMEKGKPYRMKYRMTDGGGGDYLRLAMRIHDAYALENKTTPPLMQEMLSFRSVQSVRFSVDATESFAYETHTITYIRDGFADKSLIPDYLFTVKIQSGINQATLSLSGEADADTVRTALIDLSYPDQTSETGMRRLLSCDPLVKRTDENVTRVWSIIMPCLNYNTPDILLMDIREVTGGSTCASCVSSALAAVASTPITGTFQLGYGNIASAPIDIGTGDAADFVSAFAEVGVTVEATRVDSTNHQYVAEWGGHFRTPTTWEYALSFTGSPPLLTRSLSGIRGDGGYITVRIIDLGALDDLFYDPIPAQFLRSEEILPQVEIYSSGILATSKTVGAASYQFINAYTQKITAVSPARVKGGTYVTISYAPPTGATALATPPRDLVNVTIGNGVCLVNTTSAGTIECTMQEGFAGVYAPRVVLGDMGLASVAAGVTVEYILDIAVAGPFESGLGGGSVLTLVGQGLYTENPCEEVALDGYTRFKTLNVVLGPQAGLARRSEQTFPPVTVECEAPAAPGDTIPSVSDLMELYKMQNPEDFPVTSGAAGGGAAGGTSGAAGGTNGTNGTNGTRRLSNILTRSWNLTYPLTFGGQEIGTFVYVMNATPVVQSITPPQAPFAVTTVLTLYGYGFPDLTEVDTEDTAFPFHEYVIVEIGDRTCYVVSSSVREIKCRVNREQFTSSSDFFPEPYVWVNNTGVALVDTSVDVRFTVKELTPDGGSLGGGTIVTVEGYGFTADTTAVIRSYPVVYWYGTVGPRERNTPCRVLSVNHTDVADVLACETASALYEEDLPGTLVLSIGPLESVCDPAAGPGACGFTFNRSQTLSVISTSPRSGSTHANTVVTMTISGQIRDTADTVVLFGEYVCPAGDAQYVSAQCPDCGRNGRCALDLSTQPYVATCICDSMYYGTLCENACDCLVAGTASCGGEGPWATSAQTCECNTNFVGT
jgi:hypothetical protein